MLLLLSLNHDVDGFSQGLCPWLMRGNFRYLEAITEKSVELDLFFNFSNAQKNFTFDRVEILAKFPEQGFCVVEVLEVDIVKEKLSEVLLFYVLFQEVIL